MFTVAACGGGSSTSGSSDAAASGGELTLAIITPPKSFAVGAMASSGPESTYYQAVYDTLLALDAEGKPAANLATEWKYDAASTTLSLTLRSDVTFTDGTKFDADAVKANLEKAKQATGEAGSALKAVDTVTSWTRRTPTLCSAPLIPRWSTVSPVPRGTWPARRR